MTTIPVPAPPKSAFNKDRPVSDLLSGQLKHFAHIEASLPPSLRSGMRPRDYATEQGAAKYIAHLTNALKSLNQAKAPTPISKSPSRNTPSAAQSLALAAAADEVAAPQQEKSKPAKKTPTSIRPGRKA